MLCGFLEVRILGAISVHRYNSLILIMMGTFNVISYVEHLLGSTRICNLKEIPRNKRDSSYFVLFCIFWQICSVFDVFIACL